MSPALGQEIRLFVWLLLVNRFDGHQWLRLVGLRMRVRMHCGTVSVGMFVD